MVMFLCFTIAGGLVYGRGLHSSTPQLNFSRFWSLKPQQASTYQLNMRFLLPMRPVNIVHKKCSR